jgi:hypothetical protein
MTGQNRSTAVMQRRNSAPDSLDYFPTPPFATRALLEFLASIGEPLGELSAWEPACGEMHMVRPLREAFADVRASDVQAYGAFAPMGGGDAAGHELLDFALLGRFEPQVDWVITNPPFKLAEAFIASGLAVARRGVAMLVRSAFLESEGRGTLFRETPPDWVLQFQERVVMLKDRLIRRGAIDPFHDVPGAKASTATAYVWLLWLPAGNAPRETRLRWIEPCMERLERAGDYPDYAQAGEVAAAPLFGALASGPFEGVVA